VPRRPLIPSALASRPFRLAEALEHGLTKNRLSGRTWTRLGGGLYALASIADKPLVSLNAAIQRLPDDAVFSGRTAAWLHGLDSPPCSPIELTLPITSPISRLAGLSVRRRAISTDEVVLRRGLRTTSALRTVADLGRDLSLVDAVAALDMALHRRLVSLQQLASWVQAHAGCRGVKRLRRAIQLSEPAAESVMETRLRMLLVLSGLPTPCAQVSLFDPSGGFIARPDLYYPDKRLAIEYDGVSHRNNLAADNRRQNRLLESGYRLLRFTAADVLHTPAAWVDLVRSALV
jgi:very-short-patch-repair endonuclease